MSKMTKPTPPLPWETPYDVLEEIKDIWLDLERGAWFDEVEVTNFFEELYKDGVPDMQTTLDKMKASRRLHQSWDLWEPFACHLAWEWHNVYGDE